MKSEFVPDSAGARFGRVVRTRQAGEFLMRLSRYGPGLSLPVHHHPRGYFAFLVHGEMDERTEGRHQRFQAGSLHFHPAQEPHEGRTGPSGMTCLSIVPLGGMAERIGSAGCEPRATGAMRWHAARCYHAFHDDDDLSSLCAEAAALELVAALLRQWDGSPSRAPGWLEAVRSHLERHFAERLRLADLAAVAGVHQVYLARAFRRHVGTTPGAYVRRLRIDAARAELAASAKPIAEIALGSGFSSQAHLTRVFHREVGLPPGAYRRRHRERRG